MKEKEILLSNYRSGKFTQKSFADSLHMSERQYRRIEKGECNPDIWLAMQIADLLGIYDLRKLWRVKIKSDT